MSGLHLSDLNKETTYLLTYLLTYRRIYEQTDTCTAREQHAFSRWLL